MNVDYNKNFLNDMDLMNDFMALTKKEFLQEHPNITKNEYEITLKHYKSVYHN